MSQVSKKRKSLGDDSKQNGHANEKMSELNQNGKSCEFSKIAIGDKLSVTNYYTVESIDHATERIHVKDQSGFPFGISKGIVEKENFSAQQFDREEHVTRTDLIQKFMSAKEAVFTVCFDKQLKEEDVAKMLNEIDPSDLSTAKTRKTVAKRLLQGLERNQFLRLKTGEERVLVGYLVNSQPDFARSYCVDLELPPSSYRLRLVDHRTLKWMILKNVKYIAKK